MKKPERFANLYTADGETLTGTPWEVYPRPLLRRDSCLNLNGWWDFTVVEDGESVPATYDRRIRVPYCPESLLSGVGITPDPGSHLWYRRSFLLPAGFRHDRVLLHIGAADQITYVYCNGRYVGEHTGGYDPITMDITACLEEQNVLEIQVVDNLPDATLPYGKQCRKRGGMWYTPVSGIWQTVWLESVPAEYITGVTVDTDEQGATIRVRGVAAGTVTVCTPEGELSLPLADGTARVELPTPRLWCPEDPYLYEFTVCAGEDRIISYFALRTLDIRRVDGIPRLCLNGRPVFFHGVLDQGYWSDGLFTPATPDGYEKDIRQMQALGFNTLRKHIKIEPEQFYYDCDRLGMLVWQDMVNNGDYSFLWDTALPTVGLKHRDDRRMHRDPATRAAFEQGMEQTVRQLGGHPCIVGWTIFNEGWGQFDSDRLYHRLKALDPTRFVDTASGWFTGAHSDVVSEHVYFKPYRHRPADKPVLLSEFGGYSYKPAGHVYNVDKTYGYRLFTEQAAYEDALEQLYRQQIIPAVSKGLCGAVYTQLSDIEDETNGLMSYDRRVCKVNAGRMRAIAQELRIK